MAEAGYRTGPNRTDENRLKHACDAGFLSNYAEDSSDPRQSSVSESCSDSYLIGGESTRKMADLSASFRVFTESLVRMEQAEVEMIKSREALRCEAEKRRAESEFELTRMLLQTQYQIASFVADSGQSRSRKRKRVEEDETQLSRRNGALLLSILQCNLIL